MIVMAGFVDVAIPWRADVFAGAPQSSSAEKFGTLGIDLRARKVASDREIDDELTRLSCEV